MSGFRLMATCRTHTAQSKHSMIVVLELVFPARSPLCLSSLSWISQSLQTNARVLHLCSLLTVLLFSFKVWHTWWWETKVGSLFPDRCSFSHSSSSCLCSSFVSLVSLYTEGIKKLRLSHPHWDPKCFWAACSTLREIGTREPQLWGRGMMFMVLWRVNGIGVEFTSLFILLVHLYFMNGFPTVVFMWMEISRSLK